MDAGRFSHRELELLSALRNLGGSARSSELAKHMNVSEETIRRGIKSLSKAGALERVHGGAYLIGGVGDPSYFQRMGLFQQEKRRIAKHVAKQVRGNMTVFLDVGSTTAFVAERLRKLSGLTIVTNSMGIAQTLMGTSDNRVHFLGGEMHSKERGTFGTQTEKQAQRFVFDVAVLSVDGLSAKRGASFANVAEATLSEVVAECSERVVIGMDHNKFGLKAPHVGLSPKAIHSLIVDKKPEKEMARALKSWDVALVVVPDERTDGETDACLEDKE